jgi:ribonucleoside-diphosphate reductase alpha chain
MAQFPAKKLQNLVMNSEHLVLGYANLGSLLMLQGIPYDSREAFAIAVH